ncbi:MAG: hypothetical protein ABSD74_20435, partial [Rhizomicrobium sp.]
ADVTAVGIVPPAVSGKVDEEPKRLINSNVALELGFAIRSLGTEGILMVMNRHYGDRKDLPFDLQHRAGPLIFDLPPNSEPDAKNAAFARLRGELVAALKLYVAEQAEARRADTPFPAASAMTTGPALFFDPEEVLASAGEPGEQEFRFDGDRVAYMRIHPIGNSGSISRTKIARAFDAKMPSILSPTTKIGGMTGRNAHGPIIFDYLGTTHLKNLTQGFPTGELWGVSGSIFRPAHWKNWKTQEIEERFVLPMISFEQMIERALGNYVRVQQEFGFSAPYTVVIGVWGLRGVFLAMPGGPLGNGDYAGPVLQDGFQRTYTLASTDSAAVSSLLRQFFSEVYDLVERDRREIYSEQDIHVHQLVPHE